jgi:uroporphyrin-III C-methyltransferase
MSLAIRPNSCVYLVGAGPGAPDLLTLRAARLLEQADVVLHDALVHPETLALARRAVIVSVGKRAGKHSTEQRFINKRLVDLARKHARVVRLKGGDPMLFGRAQEEVAALEAAGIPYEVVPGVTAALAASAELGTSLTRRGVARHVLFATPRVGDGEVGSDWLSAAAAADTVVLYMASRQSAAVAAALIDAGRAAQTPAVVMESVSAPTASQWATTLGELARRPLALDGPALLMIGEVYRDLCARPVRAFLQAGGRVSANDPRASSRSAHALRLG